MHALAASTAADAAGTLLALVIVIASLAAYWTPTLVAWIRRVPNAGSVTVINGFLGWTIVGWIVALAMACRSHRPQLNMTPPNGAAR